MENTVSPKYIACKLDVSSWATPEFLERCGGKLFVSGVFDDNVNTYLCSATPTVWVDFLELVPAQYPEHEDVAESLNLELLEALHTLDSMGDYFNRSEVESLQKQVPEYFQVLDMEAGCSMDDVREYLQGNPRF